MLLIRLWNCLTGYVIIKITGEYGERLLNSAALKKIYLWDIERKNSNELIVKVNVRDFFKLARLAKKTRSRVHILQRAGLFFIIIRLKKRKAFLFGVLIFVMAICIISLFIWDIEVRCEDEALGTSIIESLDRWGLKEGIFKHSIDKKYYLDRLLIEYNNVAWAEMEIKGSKLIVELVKKQLPPKLEENTPCDIIASKDGIIEEIIILRGEALVEPGQTVSKGDVLVAGKIILNEEQLEEQDKGTEENVLWVHAQGIVKARVWHQKAVKIPLIKTKKTPTGNTKKSIVIQFGNKVFNLHLGSIPYTLYDKKHLKELNILPQSVGGLKCSIIEFIELETVREFIGIEEASQVAEAELLQQLGDISKSDKVNQKKMEFLLGPDEKSVIGTITLEVVEDIGQKRKINH